MDERIDVILDFWIGPAADDPAEAKKRTRLWYGSGSDGDELIRERFRDDLARAESGEYDAWEDSPRGALALVILLDQFSRNIYRGTAAAFGNDEQAQGIAERALQRGFDRDLPIVATAFLLHPLHHAEHRQLQDRCVSMFESLGEHGGEAWRPLLESFIEYAREHRDIIVRFGRFPHRNAALGRTSTREEIQYLESGARRYGQ